MMRRAVKSRKYASREYNVFLGYNLIIDFSDFSAIVLMLEVSIYKDLGRRAL